MDLFESVNDGTVDYGYDDESQLTAADYTFANSGITDFGMTYDDTGNRSATGYVVTADNRTTEDSQYSYTYDGEGNRITRTDKVTGNVENYTWDARNRLISVVETTAPDPMTSATTEVDRVHYTYDPLNRRLTRSVSVNNDPAQIEVFVNDGLRSDLGGAGDDVIAKLDGAGNLTNRYLHGAMVDQVLADQVISGGNVTTQWLLGDHQGTIRDIATGSGTGTTVNTHRVYDAHGNLIEQTGTLETDYGYTGRTWDEAADLYFYRERYYDPHLGQFTSEDPLGFAAGDENLRGYVGNGPTTATDPSGLEGEGQHWVSIGAAYRVYKDKLISWQDLAYFAGRRSGGLTAPHNWGTIYGGVKHPYYSELVEAELRKWAAAPRHGDVSRKQFADNIRDGKTWDRSADHPEIKTFNDGVRSDMRARTTANLMDGEGQTDEKIIKKGETSLRKRGKEMLLIAALGSIASAAEAASLAKGTKDVLVNSPSMKRAIQAAEVGNIELVREHLIGVANYENASVADELRTQNVLMGETFRGVARTQLDQLAKDLKEFEAFLNSLPAESSALPPQIRPSLIEQTPSVPRPTISEPTPRSNGKKISRGEEILQLMIEVQNEFNRQNRGK